MRTNRQLIMCLIFLIVPYIVGCEANPSAEPEAGLVESVKPNSDPSDAQLAQLIESHSALTFQDAGIGVDGALTTLDYQKRMDLLRGKSVGFVALLDDVYRTNQGYKAVFGAFEMGFDAAFVLSLNEKDAQRLVEIAHKDQSVFYTVIAKIDALKITYSPANYVEGETGDDPDSMDVEEFGLEIGRTISGTLIAIEPERKQAN